MRGSKSTMAASSAPGATSSTPLCPGSTARVTQKRWTTPFSARTMRGDRRGNGRYHGGRITMSAQQGPKIVVLGRMCFNPFGGVVWQALHYMLGLRQLGFDPYYVEGHGKWVADPVNASTNPEMPRVMIGEVMQRFGFADHWMCRADYIEKGYSFGGMSQKKLASVCADAEAILNLTATNVIDAEQYECPRRIYLETDPGVPQIRLTENDPKIWNLVSSHTHHFTFAENLGNADCGLPKPS